MFIAIQENDPIYLKLDHVSLDSTVIKVHPDGTGAFKKTAHNQSENHVVVGQLKFIW